MKSYIAVGSNLGNKHLLVHEAVQYINELPNTCVVRMSDWHETEPVGLPVGAENFLNGVLEVNTELSAPELMNALLEIETMMGRVRTKTGYESRIIDLDFLLYGDQVINSSELKIPHPRMIKRLFVMKPLHELCPDFIIPGDVLSVSDILKQLLHPQDIHN